MLKDGSGWGAMKGVAAAKLAQKGFTGASAITLKEAHKYWADIFRRWYMGEQYYEPYPVCRWAQAPVEGARSSMQRHGFCEGIYERSGSIHFAKLLGFRPIRHERPKRRNIQPLFQ